MEEDFPLRTWNGRNWSGRNSASVSLKKSYLQAASIPKWKLSDLRSSVSDGKESYVLVNFEDSVERSFQMSRCLIGSIGGPKHDFEGLAAVNRWMDRSWNIPGGVDVKEIDNDKFLVIFPSRELAEEKIGRHLINSWPIFLDKWHSWSCCSRRGWSQFSTWIRVIGLPVFLWDNGVFESIGDLCGGYLETAEETTMQSHFKWVKLKIKGHGRNVPASVRIKVGNTMYDCPIWVDRSPWVDWIPNQKNFFSDQQLPERRKEVAREGTIPLEKVHAPGRQRGRNFNEFGNQKKSNKSIQKKGKVQWIKVSVKNMDYLKGHSAFYTNVGQPTFNESELLDSLNGPLDVELKKEQTSTSSADIESTFLMLEKGGENKTDSVIPPKEVQLLGDLFSGKEMTCGPGEELGLGPQSDCSIVSDNGSVPEDFPTIINAHFSEPNEIIDCLPLATYKPEDWNLSNDWNSTPGTLLLGDCGADQEKISKWVINRMKTLKKILGISSEAFEDKIFDLLRSIEEKRGFNLNKEGKKSVGSSKKGFRELKNLQCSISYEKKAQNHVAGGRTSDDPLPICFK